MLKTDQKLNGTFAAVSYWTRTRSTIRSGNLARVTRLHADNVLVLEEVLARAGRWRQRRTFRNKEPVELIWFDKPVWHVAVTIPTKGIE